MNSINLMQPGVVGRTQLGQKRFEFVFKVFQKLFSVMYSPKTKPNGRTLSNYFLKSDFKNDMAPLLILWKENPKNIR